MLQYILLGPPSAHSYLHASVEAIKEADDIKVIEISNLSKLELLGEIDGWDKVIPLKEEHLHLFISAGLIEMKEWYVSNGTNTVAWIETPNFIRQNRIKYPNTEQLVDITMSHQYTPFHELPIEERRHITLEAARSILKSLGFYVLSTSTASQLISNRPEDFEKHGTCTEREILLETDKSVMVEIFQHRYTERVFVRVCETDEVVECKDVFTAMQEAVQLTYDYLKG